MKKRKIIRATYELLGQFLKLEEGEFITDIISESSERCSECILIKVGTSFDDELAAGFYVVPEGQEIPREDLKPQKETAE